MIKVSELLPGDLFCLTNTRGWFAFCISNNLMKGLGENKPFHRVTIFEFSDDDYAGIFVWDSYDRLNVHLLSRL